MIELYPSSTVALSLPDFEHVSPTSLWIGFECFVQVPVEKADFRFVLKSGIYQRFCILAKYPVIVIEVDDEICRLGSMGLGVQFHCVEVDGPVRLPGRLGLDRFFCDFLKPPNGGGLQVNVV